MRKRTIGSVRWTGLSLGLVLTGVTRLAAAQSSVPEPPPPAEPWYEAVQLRAFADGYYNANFGFPKPQSYQPPTRAYDGAQGFGLSWVGLDAAFEPQPVGGMLSLRFGPTATTLAAGDAGTGLEYVKQAYASWKPVSALTLDLGKFDTMVGAEVPESQDDFNYTRGLLHTLAQPHFHTGLRATVELVPEISLMAMAANATDRTMDNNVGKTFGLGVHVNPSEAFAASLAWIGGPEQADSIETQCPSGTAYDPGAAGCAASAGTPAQSYVVDRGGANEFKAWRHVVDLVLSVQPLENLTFVVNGDYGVEGMRPADTSVDATTRTERWYGGALMARMGLSDVWAVAVRGEYLADPQGHVLRAMMADQAPDKANLASGTLTLEARPSDNLILRLDTRGDFVTDASPSKKIFREKERDSSSKLITTTLGVVVTTN
jgi:hypothetical protein